MNGHSGATIKRARALEAAGTPRLVAARQLGVHPQALQRWLGPRFEKRTREERARACELKVQGKTYGQIAYLLGVSRTTARRWVLHGRDISR